MSTNRLSQERALAFMTAGNAIIILHSMKTNKQFRYQITVGRINKNSWNVYDLQNSFAGKGLYIGTISDQWRFYSHAAASDTQSGPAQKAMEYLVKHLRIQQVPEELHILHTGYCSYCSRPLTDAVSLEYGIGPTCRKKLGIQ